MQCDVYANVQTIEEKLAFAGFFFEILRIMFCLIIIVLVMYTQYTTSIARLKLLSYLQLIERTPGTTILYVDTDSVSQKTFIHC